MSLPKLELPNNLNYIGVFFTLSCNLRCSYCINIPDSNQENSERDNLFPIQTKRSHTGMVPEQWVEALNRIPEREDLPITAQGGEPTMYYGGKGLGQIFKGVDHHFDLLTNMASLSFYKTLEDQRHKLQRKAPYPSIRVSWHKDEMNRVWSEHGFETLVNRCLALKDYGFNVSSVKSESDVGIYMVAHPDNEQPDEALWKGQVPFETKEFLGVHDGELYGTYKYEHSTDLISRGIWPRTLECECRTSELLLDPYGFVWDCHYHLYEANAKYKKYLEDYFNFLVVEDFRFRVWHDWDGEVIKPIGHILDPDFSMDDLKQFRKCYDYGKCVGCDVKLKNDRTQSLDDRGVAHASVEIQNIRWPKGLR